MTTAAAPAPPSWSELLREQQGVISRAQALAAGLTRERWQWQLDSGRWRPLLPGVAVAHSGHVSEEELAWAAVLFGGPSSALTGDAALRAYGMTLPAPATWHVVTPVPRQASAQQFRLGGDDPAPRVQPHRLHRVAELAHPAKRPALLRAAPALLHAAGWATSARVAEARVAAAVQQRLVTPQQVRDAAAVLCRTPRRALVMTVLDDVELGAHARSELDFLAFLRRNGLPLPDRLQLVERPRTSRCYLDAWYERQRVSVEVDGSHHRLVGPWESDLLRGSWLAVSHRDDRVLQLRLTPGQLRHDEPEMAELFRRALL